MNKLLALLCVATLVACATPPRPAAVAVPPPLPAQAVTDTHFGVQVADPYRHLENVSDPQVQAWMRAQADAANAALSQLPGRAALLERIKTVEGAAGGVTTTVIRTDSGRLFSCAATRARTSSSWSGATAPTGPTTSSSTPRRVSPPAHSRAR